MSKRSNRHTIIVLIAVGVVATVIAVFISGINAIAPQGHGSLRGYTYNTTDKSLQKAVWSVIKSNPAIEKDATRGSDGSVDYYNDSVNYITIQIKAKQGVKYQYTFRYYGDSELRATTTISELFICYADGGSEGNDRFRNQKQLKNELLTLFEEQLIKPLDSTLNLHHTIN
jgi:hypothetical protein